MAEVTLKGLCKSFGDIEALKDLDLTVGDGEFVVLLGPTGAGKTTTLRLAAGLEKPDAGTIWIGQRNVTGEAPATRDVAFVFQQYSLYPHYSVFDNLAFPLRAPGRKFDASQIKDRVEEIATLLRIEDKLRNRVTQLSGGEMQRVAIGRALVRSPAVFLMDEPLSSLDAKLREDLRIELKRIQRDLGATVLYVTHDQLEAMTLADRIGVLSKGELIQLDAPRTVYERPNSVYVARRLGSPQINLLPVAAIANGQAPAAAKTIGVRPEDVFLGTGETEAELITTEHLGAETVFLMDLGGQRLHVLAGAHDRLRTGQRIKLHIRPEAALYFDASGQRVASA